MTEGLPDELAYRLGYLLKHAQQRLARAAEPAMAPFGIDGRELAILTVLAAGAPLSQQQAAERLGVDRTTMVALIDALETKGLVSRQRSPEDRRRNLVQLTPPGEDCLRRATKARDQVEREFLAPLGGTLSRQFVRALQILATPADGAS
ncbi:MAG TPA: MarR family transcriptional regulator [Streptosporangiaceae bacterium]|jgi:DNA-binding MarR family transcriptional regulator